MKSNPAKGYICVIVAALMWASSGTFGKFLFHTGIAPFDLVQIRVTLATVFLAGFMGIFNRTFFHIRIKDLSYFLFLGGVLMALLQLSYFFAISKIQVAAAILLEYLAPMIVACFSICFWHERLSILKIASLLLSVTGCYLVVGGYNLDLLQMNREGVMWGLSAAVSFAAYSLFGERGMHRYQPWTVLFYALFFASFPLNLFHTPLVFIHNSYSSSQWLCLIYLIIFGTIIPFGLYYVGINHIRSTRTMITATLEPISAAFMAFILLGETLQPLQLMGGFSVVISIILLQLQREHDVMTPAAIRSQQKT